MNRLLLISTSSFENRTQQQLNAVKAAEKSGVNHLIYTSIPIGLDPSLDIVKDHANTEDAIRKSKIPNWTILRNNWYYENLIWIIPELKNDKWIHANADGKMAYVSRDDLALAAANVLAKAFHKKEIINLSGSNAYTTDEIAKFLSNISGKNIQVENISPEALETQLVKSDYPEALAKVVATSQLLAAQGGLSEVTNDLEKIIGRLPKKLEDWLIENKNLF